MRILMDQPNVKGAVTYHITLTADENHHVSKVRKLQHMNGAYAFQLFVIACRVLPTLTAELLGSAHRVGFDLDQFNPFSDVKFMEGLEEDKSIE